MRKKLLKFILTSLFGILSLATSAQMPSDTQTSEKVTQSNIIKTPSGDSIVSTLDMGAHATEFWRKIQALIAEPDMLRDFPRVVKHLNLDLTDHIGKFDSDKVENQEILNIKDAFPNTHTARFISNGSFGVSNFGKSFESYRRYLSIDLQPILICLSGREVERVYGKTKRIAAFGSHSPPSIAQINNPIGYGYSMGYQFLQANLEINFSVGVSGCVYRISLTQSFSQLSKGQ